MEELADRYHSDLNETALAWLRKRGITDETIKKQKLGYVIEGRYENSISIPYMNPYGGEVRTIRYRFLAPNPTKYLSTRGSGTNLYNVENTTCDQVWICEGEFDSLILSQMGHTAIAVPGSSAFKDDWKYLFANCERVSLVFDSDEAGNRGSKRIASILGGVVEDLRLIHLPEGMDVTDYYLMNPQGLESLVSS